MPAINKKKYCVVDSRTQGGVFIIYLRLNHRCSGRVRDSKQKAPAGVRPVRRSEFTAAKSRSEHNDHCFVIVGRQGDTESGLVSVEETQLVKE